MTHKHHIRAVFFDLDGTFFREWEHDRASNEQAGQAELVPGMVDLIDELRKRGVFVGLCSADGNAHAALRALELENCFDTIIGGADVVRPKPHPQVYQRAAEGLGIPAFHCLVFADCASGVEAARDARMKCVGVGEPDDLAEAPSVIRTCREIDVPALLDSGRPFRPEPHGWELVEGQFRPARSCYWETMLAVTNGVIGVRGNLEEQTEGVASYPATFVNGIVGYIPYDYMWAFPGYPDRGHCMLNVCEWSAVRLQVDGEWFSMRDADLKSHRRWLDMRRGVLFRQWTWKTQSKVTVNVRTRRLASMRRRHLAALAYEVNVSASCSVVVETDCDASPESRHFNGKGIDVDDYTVKGQGHVFSQRSHTSGQQLVTGIRHNFEGPNGRIEPEVTRDSTRCLVRYGFDLEKAQAVSLEKVAVFKTHLESESENLVSGVEALLEDAPPFETLFGEQVEWWENYWALADVEIEGDALDQLGVRLSLFHNRQSNPEDGCRSIGANGMTGDNYAGHVFWDTEQYIATPFLYTEPESVRGLLEYRYRILDEARKRARLMQSVGAEYSWNSITGEECGHVFEAAQGQIHLQSDIAWAIDRYVLATDDRDFLHTMGAEIIFETARYLLDRGAYSPHKGNRFVFNAVCGPNEYSCGVDNNAYTNYLVKWHFRRAAEIFREMEETVPSLLGKLNAKTGLNAEEVKRWREASERMYLPYDRPLGIVPQDDNFLGRDPVDMNKIPFHTDVRTLVHPLNLWRMQLIKQADTVLLMFLLREAFDTETVRRTYQFHEVRTNHGSSLSACMHCIVASDAGHQEEAYRFFRESALMDINDLKGNTAGGVHSACLGGTWMAVVNGFAGMRDDSRGLRFSPGLPQKWTRLAFQLVWRKTRIGVEVARKSVTYRHLAGPPVSFAHEDTVIELAANTKKEIAL